MVLTFLWKRLSVTSIRIELQLTATRIRVVKVLCTRLRHGSSLIRQLKGSLGGESDLMLFLHLIDLGLLLLHDVGELELVLQL